MKHYIILNHKSRHYLKDVCIDSYEVIVTKLELRRIMNNEYIIDIRYEYPYIYLGC